MDRDKYEALQIQFLCVVTGTNFKTVWRNMATITDYKTNFRFLSRSGSRDQCEKFHNLPSCDDSEAQRSALNTDMITDCDNLEQLEKMVNVLHLRVVLK